MEGLFSGVDNFEKTLAPDALGQLNASLSGVGDRSTGRMRAANIAFMADRFGKPVEEVAGFYDQYKASFAKQALKSPDELDDAGFYGKVGGLLKSEREERGLLQSMTVDVFEGLRKGQDFNQTFASQKANRGTGPGWDPARADFYRQFAKQQWDRFTETRAKLEPVIAPVVAFMKSAKAGAAPGEEEKAIKLRETALAALKTLSDNDAEMVMDFAAGQSTKDTAGDKPAGFAEKLERRTERGVDRLITNTVGTVRELLRRQREVDASRYPNSTFLQDRAAGVTDERRSDQLERKLAQRITGEVDPLKANGWIVNGVLSAAESVPQMLTSLSIPGIVVNLAANKEDIRGQYEDAGMTPGRADLLSSIAAVPYTALDFVQAKMVIGGKLPGLTKFLTKPVTTLGALGARTAIVAAGQLTEQFAQEELQNLTAPAVQSVAHAFDQAIPEVNWTKEFANLKAGAPETIAALLPLVLIGTGRGAFQDRAYGLQFLQRERELRAVGLSTPAITEILAATSPEQAASALQAAWSKRETSPEQAAAVVEMNNEAKTARSESVGIGTAPEGVLSASDQVKAKYPDRFANDDGGDGIAIEIRRADGVVVPGVLNGYYDETIPSVGKWSPGGENVAPGWSHGILGPGEEIVTAVPSQSEWLEGQREVYPTPAPADLGAETIEGQNPNPVEPPPAGTVPPFVAPEDEALAKTPRQWERIAGTVRKIDRKIRGLGPTENAARDRLLLQRLEIQADAGIPGANEALLGYHNEVARREAAPNVGKAIQQFVASNPLAHPKSEGAAGMTMSGELRKLWENLTPAQRRKAFRKDGETDLDTYASNLVEYLENKGVIQEGRDTSEVVARMFGVNVLDGISDAFNQKNEPLVVPRIDREVPGRPVSDKLHVVRSEGGEYQVSNAGGVIGTADSAEMAASIVRDHRQGQAAAEAAPAASIGPSESLQLRSDASSMMADPEILRSVFENGKANRATVHTTRAAGIEGKVSAPAVIDALANVLGAGGQSENSLRFGRIAPGMKAAGFYSTKSRIIRVKTSNNIETAAHEVAHGIEDALWGIGHVWTQSKVGMGTAGIELQKLGKDLYGDRIPAGGFESEGFAEFFRLFITDPGKAQEKAPVFFQNWTDSILPGKPELQKAVLAAQQAGTTFYGQGSLERARQGIIQQPTTVENVKTFTEEQLGTVRRKWIEAAAPIADFVEAANAQGPKIEHESDPYATLVSRRLTADSVASYMATKGMLDFSGNVTGKPLQDAFSIVKGREHDFVLYLWANRALALWNDPNGPRNPGLAKVDAEAIVEQLGDEKMSLAAQQVYDWNNGVLSYAAEASPDFAETVAKIRAVDPGFYIPLFREFSALDDRYTGRGGVKGKNLVAHLKGSGRRIKDPVESMLAAAKATILKAHQKAVLDQIIRIAESTPGLGHLVVEVPRDKVPTNISASDAFQRVMALMKEKTGLKETPEQIQARQGIAEELDGEVLTFFMPAMAPKQNEAPVLPVFRNGKTKWFEMDPELYKSISGMDLYRLPRVLDLFLGMPARTLRVGTTGLRAAFSLVTNPLRDLRTLQMNSQASANSVELFGHWLTALRDVAMETFSGGKFHSEWSDLAERLGVHMAGSLTQDTLPLQQAARKLKRGGDWSAFDPGDTMNVIRQVLQFPETASRLAEVKAVAKDLGWDPSQPLTPSIAGKLATAGKQVTTDFTQAGEYARVLNQAIPFFNAGIQGPVAHVRALKADPMRFVMRGLTGTALALGLWWRNKDEDWWKEMSSKERYLFTYIPVGKELIRIPRSYEVDGAFMAMTEALADAAYRKEPRRFAEWFGRYAEQFSQIDVVNGIPVPPLPVLPRLLAEQLSNRNFFFDRPIVPRGELENLRPEEQYNAFSTNVAIEAGDILGVSPRRIDHLINGVFGPVGGDLTSLLGRGKDKIAIKRETEPADLPVLGTLFQRGGQSPRSPESIDKLYDAYDAALKTQYSKREKETVDQRQVRLMLVDAVKTQTALSLLEREIPERDKRNRMEALRVSVAKTAVIMAQSGNIDRAPNRQILSEAKRELSNLEREKDLDK